MGSRSDRKRLNVDGDRVSSLPDDLVHKILSSFDIKNVIETSGVSSRWRYIWTSTPCLNFSNKDFRTFAKFAEFVTRVMNGRNNQAEVSSVKLTFHGRGSHAFFKTILNIIFSHECSQNVEQLHITNGSNGKEIESPISLFNCQSLKHLTLIGYTYIHPITNTPTWEMSTLTTLDLERVTFYTDNTGDGLFSNFVNLKHLTLKHCNMIGLNGFYICHPKLYSLTLDFGHAGGNVVTPQLKILNISHWRKVVTIFAPALVSLHCNENHYPLDLSAECIHLEKVDICIYHPSNAHEIVCFLEQLRSVKFLTLNLEIIELLYSFLDLISHQPSPFTDLKSLRIYPAYAREEQTQPEITMLTEVKSYFLNGSPGATFTMGSHEEIRAMKNVTLARNLMVELHVLQDQWKENSESITADMEQDKASMENHMATMPEKVDVVHQLDTEMKWLFWERETGVTELFSKGHTYTKRTSSLLREIEQVLAKLPASHRAKLQARFDDLSAVAEASMNVMVNYLRNQWDKKPRLYFYELANHLNTHSGCQRKRKNLEVDRLSSLPDDLIHKILSFIDIKHAIETSSLSSRWRYTWTSMPYLNFSNKDFLSFSKFAKFTSSVMSNRNNQVEVSSIRLTFRRKLIQAQVKRLLNIILNYESTHNVQLLKFSNQSCGSMESPLYLFSSQSREHPITTRPTWELQNLATLILCHVTFDGAITTDKSSGLYSNFVNLKNLTLKGCRSEGGSNGFNICHSRLSDLTLENGHAPCNVVAPQLMNLTIRNWQSRLNISAPDLAVIKYKDHENSLQLSGDLLHLEKADICFSYLSDKKEIAQNIVFLLQQLHSVKILTLNSEIIKLLSSYVELISHQPSPFGNLKSLNIYPYKFAFKKQTQLEVTMPTEVKCYLLDGSSQATFTMTSPEEIRVVENVTLARNLMRELRTLLDQWEENGETMPEQVEVVDQLDGIMKWHFWERMTHITEQFEKGHTYAGCTFKLLREIEGVLTKLPTSYQDKFQARFYGLCAEAEAGMDAMVKHL